MGRSLGAFSTGSQHPRCGATVSGLLSRVGFGVYQVSSPKKNGGVRVKGFASRGFVCSGSRLCIMYMFCNRFPTVVFTSGSQAICGGGWESTTRETLSQLRSVGHGSSSITKPIWNRLMRRAARGSSKAGAEGAFLTSNLRRILRDIRDSVSLGGIELVGKIRRSGILNDGCPSSVCPRLPLCCPAECDGDVGREKLPPFVSAHVRMPAPTRQSMRLEVLAAPARFQEIFG